MNVNWVAMVSNQGDTLWKYRFGTGKEVAVSALHDRILVAYFEGNGDENEKYWEDVVTLLLDRSGTVLSRQIVRTDMNRSRSAYYGNLAIEKPEDSFYVISSWQESSNVKPLEVAKVSRDGSLVWRKELPHSISQQPNRVVEVWTSCDQGQTALANGDLLVACAIGKQIFVSRLNASDGNAVTMRVALPECHQGRPAALFLMQKPNEKIWIFGSRPGSNIGASCTWLGQISLP
jgi:hypothetical protein